MDRKQKEQRAQQQDGKVFDIADLAVEERYRSPDYIYKPDTGTLAPTGRFIVFRLIPISGKLPSFEARWDGGSREPGKQEKFELDIDIVGVSKGVIKKFREAQEGYSGHHTTKIQVAKGHGYKVLIRTPNGEIFDATVSFTAHRRLGSSISTSVIANLDVEKS